MRDVNAADLMGDLARTTTATAVVFARAGFAPSDELVASLTQVEAALGHHLGVLRVDIDAAPALVAELRIHKVPELLVWAAGGTRLLARSEGAMRPGEVLDLLRVASTRG
jgi:thioredoxin-like negative regulator of GroEL